MEKIESSNDVLIIKESQDLLLSLISSGEASTLSDDLLDIDFDDTIILEKSVTTKRVDVSANACDIQSLPNLLDIDFDDAVILEKSVTTKRVDVSANACDIQNACACDCACSMY
ncbi:hypothetical protein [Phocaeicola sartorii]|uniref:hypothetical protein n=1 Tax=Phocaeicola sartorii TaxID=671267 RepID=UPI002582BDDF|nr:hypothetical protein [Phocaeicola sartorii]